MIALCLCLGLMALAVLAVRLVDRHYAEPTYSWGRQILIALDQLVNTLLRVWPDETFSARCWRLRERYLFWRAARLVVDGLARLCGDKDHCRLSYESELWGLQQAPETRPHRGGK